MEWKLVDQNSSEKYKEIWIGDDDLSTIFNEKSRIKKKVWREIRNRLVKNGIFRIKNFTHIIEKNLYTYDWITIISQLTYYFFPFKSESNNDLSFVKFESSEANFVTPNIVGQILSRNIPLKQVLSQMDFSQTCNIVNGLELKILGSGLEGSVLWSKKWDAQIVLKKIENVGLVIGGPENEVRYFERYFTEAQTAGLLSDLGYSDEHGKDYSLTMQRTSGFFTCPKQNGEIDLYMMYEKMDTDLENYLLSDKYNILEKKVMIWQALFTLIFINKMKWFHLDSSSRNFLVKKIVPNQIYNGTDISQADTWEFKLNGKSYFIKNVNYICKIADFGFMIHLMQPEILGSEYPKFNIYNKARIGYDVAFFLASVAGKTNESKVLVKDFMQSDEIPNKNSFIKDNGRPVGPFVNKDPEYLLSHSFFSDIFTQ